MELKCLGMNEQGRLTIGGMDVAQLAQQYGTPLYLMDEDVIRENCRAYKQALDTHYDGNGMVLYASKAFCCKRMCEIVKEEGLGIDVVSGGELYTALAAGIPPEHIYFHGNSKTDEELAMAVQHNVGTFVADNVFELERLNQIAGQAGKVANVSFRVKPGIDAHTHEFVTTGQIDSKFGFALETGEAEQAIVTASQLPHLQVTGVHCHIGSQIFEIEPFEEAARRMIHLIGDLKDKHGITVSCLNLGGGYGIRYTKQDTPVPYGDYIKRISVVVKEMAALRGVPLPKVLMEPGRSITGPAGITVYTIKAVKNIPNVRNYLLVDGGMTDNPRYIMYEAQYDAVLVNNPQGKPEQTVTIAGRCCESGDILVKDIDLPEAKPDDLIAVLATGAYNYSMASNYNRVPRPPVVMVSGGKSYVAVRRETYEDVMRNDC